MIKRWFVILVCAVFTSSSICGCGKKSPYSVGIQLLQKEVKANPNNWKLRLELAERFAKEDHFEAAEAELNQILEKAPNDPMVKEELVNVLYSNKKMDQALKLINGMIEHNPGEGIGYALLGNLDFYRGDYEKASKNLARANQLGNWATPYTLDLLYKYGFCLTKLDQEAEADKIFQEILKQDPFHEDTLYLLALQSFRRQDWVKTERYGKLLTSKYRNNYLYFLTLGLAFYHQSKWNQCRSYLRKANELDSRVRNIGKVAELTDVYQIPEDWDLALALKFNEPEQYREDGEYVVRGTVINIGFHIAKDTRVIIEYYNKEHEMVDEKITYLKPRNLMPMQMREYHVTIPDDPEIVTAKVRTAWRKHSLF